MQLVTTKTERKFAILFKLYKRSYFTYCLICTLIHTIGSNIGTTVAKNKQKLHQEFNATLINGALFKVLNCSFSDCPCSFLFKVLDAFLHILKTTDVNPSENA